MRNLSRLGLTPPQAGAGEFVRLALTLALARLDNEAPWEIAKQTNAPERVLQVLEKAAVEPGTIGDISTGGWGSELGSTFRIIAQSFVDSLRNIGVLDRLIGDNAIRRAPLRISIVTAVSGAVGAMHDEAVWKPISSINVAANTLAPQVAAAILVVTEELLRAAGTAGEAFLSRELRAAAAAVVDQYFVTALIAAAGAPLVGTGNFGTDLETLIGALASGDQSKVYLIVGPALSRHLASKHTTDRALAYPAMGVAGGFIGTLPVLVSDAVPAATGVAVDADQILGDADPPSLAASRNAALQMSSTPVNGAVAMTSMFQTDSVALKIERRFGFTIARAGAVKVMNTLS